jgi:hypothetical protein
MNGLVHWFGAETLRGCIKTIVLCSLIVGTFGLPRTEAAELTHLVCTNREPPEVQALRRERGYDTTIFVLVIDFGMRALSLFQGDAETKFLIERLNDREVVAVGMGTKMPTTLTLNRLTGDVEEAIALPRNQNKNLGVSDKVQAFATIKGACRAEEPKL